MQEDLDQIWFVLLDKFLCVNYGEIDGPYAASEISLEDLLILKRVVDIATYNRAVDSVTEMLEGHTCQEISL